MRDSLNLSGEGDLTKIVKPTIDLCHKFNDIMKALEFVGDEIT